MRDHLSEGVTCLGESGNFRTLREATFGFADVRRAANFDLHLHYFSFDLMARHMLNAPAGAKHRPLTNDLRWAVDDYMRARYPEKGQSNDAPATAIEEKLDRMSYILIRLVGGLGFQATLTVFGGDYHAIGAERDVRINVLREKLGNEHVAALYGFADEHGLELEFSAEHGVTLRLQPNWAERPVHAG